ncbi:MAG TPA: TIGR03619 family F420-dependent LLM class oxidoreductase [Dehalococcoidia bacterium]
MSIRIGLGVSGVPFSGPDAFWRLVDLCEEGDVDSLWVSERLVSLQPTLEPVATMAALAGRTRRLKFGCNAILLPLRDPLVLAKECATIDYLSGGRLLLTFGVGRDAAPEFAATGRDPSARGRQADEMLAIMTRLWSEDRVSFQGRFYRYREASIAPKPLQQPLPLWIGGSSPAAVRRTARYGTGWLGGVQTPAQVGPVVAAIKAAAAEAGRTIDEDHYGAGFPFRFGSWEEPAVQRAAAALARTPGAPDPRAYLAVGGAAEILARIDEYVAAGVSKFVLRPVAESDVDALAQTRRLMEEVIPTVHGRA